MSLTFQEFQADKFLDQQRDLYADCFPESHVSAGAKKEHYFWKFHSFPHTKASYEFSAWQGDRLIGYYAALPYRYTIGNQETTCGMVCDVMTHSSTRGQGVFTKIGKHSLTELKKAGVGFVSGYPIRPSVLPGHLKVGWCVAFSLPLYVKILKTDSLLGKIKLASLAGMGNALVKAHHKLSRLGRGFFRADYETTVFSVADFLALPQYEKFFEAWKRGQKNYLIKDKSFLRWRLGAPGTDYRFVTVWKNSELMGLAVAARIDFEDLPCFALLDMMLHPEIKARGIFELHQEMAAEALRQQVDLIVTMMSKITARRYKIFSAGFLRSPKHFKLILNKLDENLDLSALTREENWNLMWIDSDDN